MLVLGGGAVWWFWPEDVQTLVKNLDSPDAQVRLTAVQKLGTIGPGAQADVPTVVATLIPMLADPDAKVRGAVDLALDQIGPPGDASVLITTLSGRASITSNSCIIYFTRSGHEG